jgi:hypothetical protein
MALNTAGPYRPGQAMESAPVSETQQEGEQDNYWMSLARDAFETSEDWFESALRNDMERNISHFQGKHAPGSKYYSNQYKYRAKGFRPKTRAIVRKNEASAATAFFATRNVVDVTAEDPSNVYNRVSAEINKELLQYRFDNTINWFLTVVGAYQDALVNGVVISHQYWKYIERSQMVDVYDEATGQVIYNEDGSIAQDEQVTVIKDTPAIDLRPIENIRFAPTSNWMDPIGSSPFLIDRMPMTIVEVVEMMKQKTTTSKIPWIEGVGVGTLMQGRSDEYSDDQIRRQRERNRLDPVDETSYINQQYDTVWVHRNIVNDEGRDWVFYTLGVHMMLSDPIPLEEEYPHLKPGERPYVLGYALVETHKNYPQSLVGVTSGLQQEANELNNQRRDNVSLVLNRRYFVKRGQGVDLKSLQRNVPGGVTLMNNVDGDIRVEAPPDVTSSSYQEQDRINLDFDDVGGNFSTASVGSNKGLNETVGGMEMLGADADAITEYQLRVFSETWAEKVIKQIIQLEQRHESDPAIFAMIGDKMDMYERFGINKVLDDMIQGNMNVEVNVGFGATNPAQRLNRLTQAIGTVAHLAPGMMQRIDEEEVSKEVFGSIGFKNSGRFFKPPVPESEIPPEQPSEQIQLEMLRGQNQMAIEEKKFGNDQYIENLRTQNDMRKEDITMQINMSGKAADLQKFDKELEVRMQETTSKRQIALQQAKAMIASKTIDQKNANARFSEEMKVKREMGTGI